jgi:hypothetical protein
MGTETRRKPAETLPVPAKPTAKVRKNRITQERVINSEPGQGSDDKLAADQGADENGDENLAVKCKCYCQYTKIRKNIQY